MTDPSAGTVPVQRWAKQGDFLYSSPDQVKAYCKYMHYRIPIHRTEKRETTNEESLEQILRMHLSDEVLPLVLEARHIKKASTYLDDAMLGKDGRMHPRYTYLPKTGPLSSKRPNVMNFPQGRKGDVLKRAAQKIRENILPPTRHAPGGV